MLVLKQIQNILNLILLYHNEISTSIKNTRLSEVPYLPVKIRSKVGEE